MIYYVYNIETANARIFKKRRYQFDYIEPDSFERMQNNTEFSIIGCMKLKEIEKEEVSDKVVISNGLIDHYFELMPTDKMKHFSKRNLIGYALVSGGYIAVYKASKLIPLLLLIAFLAVFSIIIL